MRLEDICKVFTDGDWIESKDQSSEGIRLVQTGNIGEGKYLEKQDRAKYISEETFENLKCTEIFPGDILVSRLPEPVGRACIIPVKEERMITAVDCTICRPDEKVVLKEYLCYFMQSEVYYTCLMNNVTGTTRKRISRKNLGNVELNIPNKETQAAVVEKLNILSHVIDSRKEELEKLDELIKARFVELFGDPKLNPKKWDVVNISEVVGGKVSNGFFAKRDDYCDDGNIRVLGVANIVNRMYSNLEDLPRTNADDKDIEKFEVKYGDMLFCRSSLVAEGIGKASIIPEDVQENILFECHVIRLPLDLSKCVPEFVQTLSTMDYFRNQVISQSKTATMTTIGQAGILKTDIILPPIDKQKEFYDFVKQVDKSKVVVKKALDEAQLLFDSLMQEYFG